MEGMKLRITDFGSDKYIPPINTTLKDWRRMMRESRQSPFSNGDTVVPRFTPVDAEGKNKNQQQIHGNEPLVVDSIIKKGDTFIVTFMGKAGVYDASFFRKKR